jgi:RNA polymerase sigma-70 factor (ECF subfamily)
VPNVVAFDSDRPQVEAARRDVDAFEPLYRKYVAHIYSLALYETRDRHVAEDVTEQVFLRALDALPRFREQGAGETSTFKVWLYTIARHVIANERRRQRRHAADPIDAALELPASDDPAADAMARLEARRAWEAVRELPADRRLALELRFVNELSTREIASVMDRTEGAVRVLIHRGLASVRRRLAT